ncbi:hypothetical protein BJX64DRAFT_285183 [Aspergillus heterothallicus]
MEPKNNSNNNNRSSRINYFPKSNKSSAQYQRERKAEYPDTTEGEERERQGNAGHDEYSRLTSKANKLKKRYQTQRGMEEAEFKKMFPEECKTESVEEGEFYRNNRAALLPEQHEKLVEPASERHMARLTMANERDRFLKNHPYHYLSAEQLEIHERRRDSAFDDSIKSRQDFENHYKFAGDSTSPERDKYGRRAPRQ